jgi:hypothetical protein
LKKYYSKERNHPVAVWAPGGKPERGKERESERERERRETRERG